MEMTYDGIIDGVPTGALETGTSTTDLVKLVPGIQGKAAFIDGNGGYINFGMCTVSLSFGF